ncbi:Xylulose kinase 2 [Arabidopsis thaliana]
MADLSLPPDSLFLGFDSSTQSMKATVLDSNLNIIKTELVHFDSDLPQYKTKDGVYRDTTVNGRIVSPTLMWVEAFDLILQKLSNANFDFAKVIAVSGSGQQHGSVYWSKGSSEVLRSLDSKRSLKEQLENAFSVKESPIWMDSSTTLQCKEIENAVGGAMELSKITGSRAYERFTGPQIRKLFMTQGEVYKSTERISLVSSFMASLLVGDYACIDETDAAGMNLMDIEKRCWSKAALEATATGLEEKLGKLAPAYATAGSISQYFVQRLVSIVIRMDMICTFTCQIQRFFWLCCRFGFEKNCVVVQWSGDNPNSLAGLTLSTPGDLAISLGTSDTARLLILVFGITKELQPSLEGHVLPNPVDPESYMVMLVYKNASLTREGTHDCKLPLLSVLMCFV